VQTYFVFDVESVGLHGEGWAVGYVVVDASGTVLEEGRRSCPLAAARGTDVNREWCRTNCPALDYTYVSPWQLREWFWALWRRWAETGALMAASVPWPVEARFLAACVDDAPEAREWAGPFPLIDVHTLAHGLGLRRERRADELPEHDPLNDARAAARDLVEALSVCAAKPRPGV
jgi:hypothetical protein